MNLSDDLAPPPPGKAPRVLPRRGLTLTRLMVGVYVALGASLVMIPERFGLTPAYHNLLVLLPAQTWGILYSGSALVLAVWLSRESPRGTSAIVAHLPAVALGAWWWMAFVVRFFTDHEKSTTPVNIISWFVFVFLLLRSMYLALRDEGTG